MALGERRGSVGQDVKSRGPEWVRDGGESDVYFQVSCLKDGWRVEERDKK